MKECLSTYFMAKHHTMSSICAVTSARQLTNSSLTPSDITDSGTQWTAAVRRLLRAGSFQRRFHNRDAADLGQLACQSHTFLVRQRRGL